MENKSSEDTAISKDEAFIVPTLYTSPDAPSVQLVGPRLIGTDGKGLEWSWKGLDLSTLKEHSWTDPSDLQPSLKQEEPSQIEKGLGALLIAAKTARKKYEDMLLANSKLSDEHQETKQHTTELYNHAWWLKSIQGCADWLETGFKDKITESDSADTHYGLPKDFAERANRTDKSVLALAKAILTVRSQQVSRLSLEIRNTSVPERMDLLTASSNKLSYAQRKTMGETLRRRVGLKRPEKTAQAMNQEVETLASSLKQAEYEVTLLQDKLDKLAKKGIVIPSWSDFVSEQQNKSDEISAQAEALAGFSVTDEPAPEDTENSTEGEKTAPDPEVSKPEPDVESAPVDVCANNKEDGYPATNTSLPETAFNYASVVAGKPRPREDLQTTQISSTTTEAEVDTVVDVDDGFKTVNNRKRR